MIHEIADTVRNIISDVVWVCAAAAGIGATMLVVVCGIRMLAESGRRLAALSFVGALLIGGLAVICTVDAGAKSDAIVPVEEGTNTFVRTDGGAGSGTEGNGRFRRAGLIQGMSSVVTDEDVALGWRIVSVCSNVLAAGTFTRPPHATVWEAAEASGRGWGAWRIPLDGWRFTYGDVGWTNGFAWVEGYFRSCFESRANEIRLLGERLTLCPAANWPRYNLMASRAWCVTNGVGGLVVTFENAAVGDDPAKIASVQMELFPRTGEVALRYDLANVGGETYTAGLVVNGTNRFVEVGAGTREVVFQRVHPDDWDMDGISNTLDAAPREPLPNVGWNQTDGWAMAAFPEHVAEIATTGYAAWAAACAADPNRRLVGLHISSPNNAWPVCLTFGAHQVMCDGTEEIVFAIDCGARYPFSISDGGELTYVTLHAGTDVTEPCSAYDYPYERWANDTVVHLDSPGAGWIMRGAEVRVDGLDDTHFFPNGQASVLAVVTNCHADAYGGCQWSGGSGVSFSDCHSLETEVSWHPEDAVDWATNSVTLVTEYVGGHAVTNVYFFTVGSRVEPETDFSLLCEPVQFVNEDERKERVYPVVARLLVARNKAASISFASEGEAGPVLFWDEDATIPYEGDEFPLRLADSRVWFNECRLFIKSPQVGHGRVSAVCTVSNLVSSVGGEAEVCPLEDGMSLNGQVYSTNYSFRVIDPIRKLVTSQTDENGRCVNPSRLVAGSDAVLCVEARGPISSSEIRWGIDGPGRIVQTNDWSVTVVPTTDGGTVTVEARFNEGTVQPMFVLPIVHERVLDVKAFVVSTPDGKVALKMRQIEGLLQEVNRIFRQVGIRFNLAGYMHISDSSQYWTLPIHEVRRRFWGGEELVESEQLKQLVGTYQRMADYQGSDCIELYVVGRLVPSGLGGVTCPGEGVVVPAGCSAGELAHELGHVLGLQDSYRSKVLDENNPSAGAMSLPGELLSAACFQSRPYDWGAETGCGFYSLEDSLSTVYGQLLMSGVFWDDGLSGRDIPDGAVWSVTGDAFGATGIGFVPVGASNIFQDNGQVYTK